MSFNTSERQAIMTSRSSYRYAAHCRCGCCFPGLLAEMGNEMPQRVIRMLKRSNTATAMSQARGNIFTPKEVDQVMPDTDQ